MENFSDQYLSIRDFCTQYPFIRESQLRWLLFNAKQNGTNSFIRRPGERRILISIPKFFEWLDKREP